MADAKRQRLPYLVEHAVATFVDRLRARFGAALLDVRVFGSFARGSADDDSDVDLLVVLEQLAAGERSEVIEIASKVGGEHDFEVLLSPTVFDRATWEKWLRQERPLAMDVIRDGFSV